MFVEIPHILTQSWTKIFFAIAIAWFCQRVGVIVKVLDLGAEVLSIEPWGTNFSEIWIKIQIFLSMKMHLKISFAEWRTLCPGIVNGIFDVATNLWKDFIQEISFYASSYRTVNTLDGATSERVINYQR